jgi:RHS repeat-associated protein
MSRPNGIDTNYSYDSLSRLLSVLHQSGTSTIDGASYTLDSAGNRTAKTDDYASVTSNYTYDALYELTQVTQSSTTTESYSYDPVGNRTASLGVSSYTTNSSNEMTANSNASYTYDSNGNTLTKTVGTDTTSYAWDYENRLTSVTLPGSGGTVSFKYDPFGRRIEKILPSATRLFVYDGASLVEATDGSGSEVASYTQGPNIDEHLGMSRGTSVSYYEQDGLGSVTSLTSSSGSLAQTYTYDSFGNQTASSGSLTNFFRYAGREFDTETGLYYNRARYFNPATGRFLSPDPIGFAGGIDFYQYAINNPVAYTDSFGYAPGDNWYGYNNRDFQDWFHRNWKQPGDPDATKQKIEAAYEEWKQQGSPSRDPKTKRRQQCDQPDEEPEPPISKMMDWVESHPILVGTGIVVVGGIVIIASGGTAAPALAAGAAL